MLQQIECMRDCTHTFTKVSVLQCVAVCYSVLQCIAVCCSVLQCVASCCSVLQSVEANRMHARLHAHIQQSQCVAVRCSVL